ncbi:hypothetical protein [Streptomyces sp. MBT27]|uniref:hypothetical protein n=1 Tax=Streptomyces sp. MBT27 TaxID=1488356 RepID=UPI0014244E03|nr:hypothetical protein [Streptomyces sp. MBT27]
MGFYSLLTGPAEQGTVLETLTVEWYRTRLRVHSSAPDVHRHLASQHHTVAPDVVVPEPLPTVDLWVLADPDPFVERRLGAPTGRRQAFTGEWYTEHRGADGETVLVAEDATHPHALITPDFRSWALVAHRTESLGLLATRTVRELVREAGVLDGALMFHGSAAQRPNGRGVFLVGDAGSGKTSSAVWLGRGGGRVVGTDRTFLAPTAAGWQAVGLPVSTRLGAGSVTALGILDELRGHTPVRAINPFRAGAGAMPDPRPEPGLPVDKVWLSNSEVNDLLGVPFTAATHAHTLVVLESTTGAEPSFTRLDAADAAAALRPHLLAPDPDYRSRWLAADPAPERAEPARAGLAALVRERPVFRLRWNPAAHCDARVHDLVAAMDATGTVVVGA